MDFIKDFSGIIIQSLSDIFGGVFGGILIYTFVVCMLTFGASKKNYENMIISDLMWDDVDKLKKTYGRNLNNSKEGVQSLLSKYGYNMGQSMICTVMEAIFGLLLAMGLLSDRMSNLLDRAPSFLLYGVSIVDILDSRTWALVVGVALVILAMVSQTFHDVMYEKYVIIDQKVIDLVIIILILAAGLLLPIGFSLYWVLHELIEIGIMFFIMKTQQKMIREQVLMRLEPSTKTKNKSKK